MRRESLIIKKNKNIFNKPFKNPWIEFRIYPHLKKNLTTTSIEFSNSTQVLLKTPHQIRKMINLQGCHVLNGNVKLS